MLFLFPKKILKSYAIYLLSFTLFFALTLTKTTTTTLSNNEIVSNPTGFPIYNRVCLPAYGSNGLIKFKSNSSSFQANLTFLSDNPSTLTIAYAIYLFEQEELFGIENKTEEYRLLCNINDLPNLCPLESRGFVFRGNHEDIVTNTFKAEGGSTTNITLTGLKTGLYCFAWLENASEGSGVISIITHVHSVVGHLPAEYYPLYISSIIAFGSYSLIFILWCLKLIPYWREILPVQKFISIVFGILILEAFTSFYFLHVGNQSWPPSTHLLMISAIIISLRVALSYFLLLIICTGYSVVKPSLGSQMKRCQLLAVAHFIFHVIYTTVSVKTSGEIGIGLGLAITIPLWVTMTLFYTMTLSSLSETTLYLRARRQVVKLKMFIRLWNLIIFAAINFILYFLASGIWFYNQRNMKFYSKWWQLKWIISDGWMFYLYWICFLVIAYLWRPTKKNSRYGLEEVMVNDPLESEFNIGEEDFKKFKGLRGKNNLITTTTKIQGGGGDDAVAVFGLNGSSDDDDDDDDDNNNNNDMDEEQEENNSRKHRRQRSPVNSSNIRR